VRAYCEKQGIPLIEAEAHERKHELAEEMLPQAAGFQGLFLVITGNAPAPVWEVKRNEHGKIVDIHHRQKWPYVKHYYFHIIDPDWGHLTIRMCGYPPFGAQVILNGHEWVERQAQQRKLEVIKDGNCFVGGPDFESLNTLGDQLNQASTVNALRQVCERWIYSSCLCFGLTRSEQERSGFAYTYSFFQLELSRNLLFQRGAVLSEVYQKLIDRTRQSLELEQVKTIFGLKHRPYRHSKRGCTQPSVVKSVQAPDYDLTVFKVTWGHLTLKIYDKGERVLRVEVVVHNAKDLKSGKLLDRWPVLLERMQGMLIRFLGVMRMAHVSFLDQGAFEQWAEPTTRGLRR